MSNKKIKKYEHQARTGVFATKLNPQADDFNSSLRFDKRFFKEDINGSIAHCTMLAKQKIIPEKDAALIIKTLKQISLDIENNKVEMIGEEDIHMFVEKVLIDRIGETGKRLHTGRSRNDQVALDMRLYLKNQSNELINKIKKLIKVFCNIASKNLDTIMPAFTHLQKAQPTTLAHYLMCYCEMFYRDLLRFKDTLKRIDVNPLGSGALCGTTFNIDRKYTTKLLKMSSWAKNSMDGVSDRDFCIEFLNNLSISMMHLSRINEELIIWASNDYRYVSLDDAFSTGSSIMPQKRNPDMCELIRGKTGRVYGHLIAFLSTMKSLPLAYNKDMQEDKEGLFDALDTYHVCLDVFTNMLPTFKINKDKMYEAAQRGFIAATDVADYLVKKGLAFRAAHDIAGQLVAYCTKNNTTLDKVSLAQYKKFSNLFSSDLYKEISLETLVKNRKSIGGPNKECVKNEIKEMLVNI